MTLLEPAKDTVLEYLNQTCRCPARRASPASRNRSGWATRCVRARIDRPEPFCAAAAGTCWCSTSRAVWRRCLSGARTAQKRQYRRRRRKCRTSAVDQYGVVGVAAQRQDVPITSMVENRRVRPRPVQSHPLPGAIFCSRKSLKILSTQNAAPAAKSNLTTP